MRLESLEDMRLESLEDTADGEGHRRTVEVVKGQGEILCNVHPQKCSAADSLHSRAVDGQWGVVNRVSPEVHHNLFFLSYIKGHVVSTTSFSLLCH